MRGLFLALLAGLLGTSLAHGQLTGPGVPCEYPVPDGKEIPRLLTSSALFTGSVPGGSTNYRIFVGSIPGSGEVADTGFINLGDNTNFAVELDIPADGRQHYVRLHWTIPENVNGGTIPVLKWTDYVYFSANRHYIYAPTPGTTFNAQDEDGCKVSPSATFKWEVVPALGQPDRWWLYVGTAADDDKYYNSGEIAAGDREHTVNNIPQNGEPLIVTLWWEKGDGNNWESNVYGYNTGILPSIEVSNPLPGTEGAFVLKSNGANVAIYWVYAGTAADPDQYHSAGVTVDPPGQNESLVSFQNLPNDASQVHVTLFWRLAGEGPDKWKCRKYVYTASSGPVITSPDAAATVPTDAKVSLNSTVVTWDNRGTVAQAWQVVVNDDGDPFNNGIWQSGILGGDAREVSIPNSVFTTNGETVHVIVRYAVSGGLAEGVFTGYTARAYATKKLPYLTAPGSIGKCFTASLGNEATFEWVDGNYTFGSGQPPLGWWLYLGTERGGSQNFNSGALAADVYTVSVNNLPTDGADLWARLWYLVEEKTTTTQPQPGGGEQIVEVVTQRWLCRDFKFTNPNCPEIVSPAPGGTIVGAQQVVGINKRGVSVDGLWVTVSSQAPSGGDAKNPNPGAKDIDDSNLLDPSTDAYTVRNLPIDGSEVYITLWWLVTNNQVTSWKFRTTKYISSADLPLPSLVTPEPGTGVNATDLEFAWKTNNAVVFGWWLYVDKDNAGGFDVHNSGFIQPGEDDPNFLVKEAVAGLPCGTFFVTLWYLDQNLAWQKVQYEFTNAAGCGGGGNPGGGDGPNGE